MLLSLLGIIVLLLLAVAWYWRRSQAVECAVLNEKLQSAQAHNQALAQQLDRVQQELNQTQQQRMVLETTLKEERQRHQEQRTLLLDARTQLSDHFKVLANDILEEKARRFSEQNHLQLGRLIAPLNEHIQAFQKQVADVYDKDSKERLSLEQELKRLNALNTKLDHEAIALTRALTGANYKAQGLWGEMVLERVLESSGLTREREYRVQVSDVLHSADGVKRYQPDIVIDLPENKQLVIDSKVSLNAYLLYSAAEDGSERHTHIKAHIQAIRAHIKALSEKRYADLYRLNTLDFVFMFVPVEPAYLLAVQHDIELFDEAFAKRIMIVGPSSLLATLRTVASIWRYEYQNQNAQEIARQGGLLYDKFVGFTESVEKIGKHLDSAHENWQDAMKKLQSGTGNLISRAEKLRELGIKTNKQLVGFVPQQE